MEIPRIPLDVEHVPPDHDRGGLLSPGRLIAELGIDVSSDDPNTLFELLERLGSGAYGSVYKARNLRTRDIVAVKLVSLTHGRPIAQLVGEEIANLRACDSPWIVRFCDCYYRDEILWIAMEYCGGGSIADICQKLESPLHEEEIAQICKETLHGLMYLNANNKIHRDIKGANILLTAQGAVKLADFGVSTSLQSTVQQLNMSVGSPYWMAPEVILQSNYDFKADVWSLGVTAIELAELTPPLIDVHPIQATFMITRDPPPTLKKPSEWSSEFNDFLAHCCTKDPEDRASAESLLEHPFIAGARGPSVLQNLLRRAESVADGRNHTLAGDDPSFGRKFVSGQGPIPKSTSSTQLHRSTDDAATPSNISELLKDSVYNIHLRSNLLKLPFLTLDKLPVASFVPDNDLDLDALISELLKTTGQSVNSAALRRLPPSAANLLRTLAHQRRMQLECSMSAKEVGVCDSVVGDLTALLKTIMRV